jgi:RNA polymerase sigma-70 factor, ECF subfamily
MSCLAAYPSLDDEGRTDSEQETPQPVDNVLVGPSLADPWLQIASAARSQDELPTGHVLDDDQSGRTGSFVTSAEGDFEAFFRANYRVVLAYALRRCASRQDAEDLVAETFSVAWRRIAHVPEGDRARLWLFVTARQVHLNQERARRRQRSLVEKARDALPMGRDHVSDAEPSELERVTRALTRLSAADREVLQLSVWEELSADEIAVVLNISTSAVWKRLQRARDRFLRALGGESDEGSSVARSTPTLGKEAQ